MKIVKLNPTDARFWRQNQSVLVDKEGKFVRNVSLAEIRALGDTERKARHLRQPVRVVIQEGDRTIEIISMPTPVSRETIIIKSTVEGHEVLDGRTHFSNQVLLKHGECQLRTHTGQFMKSIRDPNVARPSAKDAMRNAPLPKNCACAGWGTPHEGRHHSICEWNSKAPPEERAHPEDSFQTPTSIPMPSVLMKQEKPSILDTPGKPAMAAAVAALPMPVPVAMAMPVARPPEGCVCQGWAKTAGSEDGKHHPICQWKESWEAMHQPVMYLMDMMTGQVGRKASGQEIQAARGEHGFVLIGETQYGVVTEDEAKSMKKGAA
jgi:hypothetical protein